MSFGLWLTPGGHLRITEDADEPAANSKEFIRLGQAFAASTAEGLIALAGHALDEPLPPDFLFWRDFARGVFERLCRLGEATVEQWAACSPAGAEELARYVSDAPPMGGLEYLTPERLERLWCDLRDLIVARANAHVDGPVAWLHSVDPVWHLLGRVTFHLAENKREPQRPFAFLATFTHGVSKQARLQHLPLAEALKMYAGSRDKAKLAALLEPVTRAATQSELVRELLDSKALFAPQAWTIRQAHRFLREAARIEQAGVVVRLPNWWSPRTPPRPQVQVRIGAAPRGSSVTDELLDFQVELALDGQPLDEQERRQLLAATDGLVLLRGKWVEVDQAQLQQALAHWQRLEQQRAGGIDFIAGMRLLAGVPLDSRSDADDTLADWSRITMGTWLADTLRQLRQPETIAACEPGRDLRATLRPYQAAGVRWLWFMTQLGLGGCLADDMGLGKTVQVIDLLLVRKRWQLERTGAAPPPSLLVVPASLLGNWRQELARFAPDLRVLFAHRSECASEELERVTADPATALSAYDLVVTSYGLCRRLDWLTKPRWSLIVLDEAQAIKNAGSSQARAVKKFQGACRLALTGTPVENHLGDLWSLFDFCCPGLLGSASQFKKFVKNIQQRQEPQAFAALRRLVRPYILRRLKSDASIAPDLPDKTEMRTECGLSRKQVVLYERAVAEFARRLETSEGMARRGLVLTMLMQFKQLCNHPAQYLAQESYPPNDSGKFARLRQLCEPIRLRQEKVLVFTQFQTLTQYLADFLADVFGQPGLVLHGSTPVGKRAELVRAFQDEQGPPFFVISLKAGGSGLNLTAACHVIHFDRWWNPAVENQATDRAFRIGQKRNVLVHKFVCRGTVEERIDALIREKQALADALLSDNPETLLTEMSDEQLLRFVALDIGRAATDE